MEAARRGIGRPAPGIERAHHVDGPRDGAGPQGRTAGGENDDGDHGAGEPETGPRSLGDHDDPPSDEETSGDVAERS